MSGQSPDSPGRVLVAGATGCIGRAVVRELVQRGYRVVALVRRLAADPALQAALSGAELRTCNIADREAVVTRGIRGEHFDAMISCIRSRSGAGQDAWAVDYRANQALLEASRAGGIAHFIMVSAISVQKPALEFQKAKLAFESELVASGLRYSIVRPAAPFSSLAGQVERVRRGKRFILFGDGELTACKPISEADLADFIVGCIPGSDRHDRVLVVGGPGPALTLREQAELLFAAAGRKPKYFRIPVALLDRLNGLLDRLGRWFPGLAERAELANVRRYYATESMLQWDAARQCYDADATPEHGADRLADFYRRLMGEDTAIQDPAAHAGFGGRTRAD